MRPITTLFMLQSIDGKISFGGCTKLSFNRQIQLLEHTSVGLYQYYEENNKINTWILSNGNMLSKLGWNRNKLDKVKSGTIVIIDNLGDLTKCGLYNLSQCYEKLIVLTDSPWADTDIKNVDIICYPYGIVLSEVLFMLYNKYGCTNLTIQCDGTLNSLFMRNGLIDNINIIVAPIIVGGINTPTIIDGRTCTCESDIMEYVKEYSLTKVNVLKESYVQMLYKKID